ncbi:hypothetical protein ACF1BQ_016945 [Bradyrhizobium sp. RDT10]
MTSLAKLLTPEATTAGQVEEDPGPNERAELERLLEKVDAALGSLEPAPSDMAEDHDSRSEPAAINKTTSPSAAGRSLAQAGADHHRDSDECSARVDLSRKGAGRCPVVSVITVQ